MITRNLLRKYTTPSPKLRHKLGCDSKLSSLRLRRALMIDDGFNEDVLQVHHTVLQKGVSIGLALKFLLQGDVFHAKLADFVFMDGLALIDKFAKSLGDISEHLHLALDFIDDLET